MIKDPSKAPAELRELSLDEIDATSGAGLISWLKKIFGGNDPKPPRGPFNRPDDHVK
jgi:hypothetical protein